ncbi:hemerythrin domain-containing protein [Bacillus sp. FJAT-27445]|uniref:hemerythrin domain-containing protein n=1 Tax=Bacillus sp. FJAT-27445 TaxID=1679166 RepID=UPI000743426A|nr:hemerythrin domain-containing protein [Bacillus sp. FJAT-27445]
MEASSAEFCVPLQQLMNEHASLRVDMILMEELTEDIEFESGPMVIGLFMQLHLLVTAFNEKLKAHSLAEEEGLFPMMARHLEENTRTIETLEMEHKKVDQHLFDFLTEADRTGLTIDEDGAQTITVYAVQALTTLTQHFANEEKVLFPLAEKVLTTNEKEELVRLLQNQ